MTYHIDIINLCFEYLHQNTHKKKVAAILKITVNTINNWINKYFDNYNNKTIITENTINEYIRPYLTWDLKIIYTSQNICIAIVL